MSTSLLCPHCRQPLSPAQQRLRAGHCGAAACRHREHQAHLAELGRSVGEAARQAARARLQGREATLLWLRPSEERHVPVPKATRAAHRAHLMQLIEAPPPPAQQALAPAAPAAGLGEQEWRLCAQCRGRCCVHGGHSHAFITLPQLLRWQQREAGRTLQDAVDWYTAQLPPRHTRGACIYQGEQGCVLPREDRADICNSYVCDALLQAQQELREDRGAAFVAVTLDGERPKRRALITGDSTTPL